MLLQRGVLLYIVPFIVANAPPCGASPSSTVSLTLCSDKPFNIPTTESLLSPITPSIDETHEEVPGLPLEDIENVDLRHREGNFAELALEPMINLETKIKTQSEAKKEISATSSISSEIAVSISLAVSSDLSSELSLSVVGESTIISLLTKTESTFDDECKFVSFEEWKKLKQAEEKSETSSSSSLLTSRVPLTADKALVSASLNKTLVKDSPTEDQGKVYKDKFNYASVNCAATVVKTNSDAKGASAILTEVKDSYLINKCSSPNKFIVIELCQEILIKSVVMGNYELFSSMFKVVKFHASERFPAVNGWTELGQFNAQNIRDVQTFDIKNPLIWARYLKIEIISHYGNEFYCPISVVRVHGTTMMEEVKNTDQNVEKESLDASISTQQSLLNYTEEIEPEECKARLPHLTLKDFLVGYNSSDEYCAPRDSDSTTTTRESANIVSTQESIFQNIMKRLALLESNSTLSLLYFEEQSKLLSEAFGSLEKRQNKRFENFVQRINSSISLQTAKLERKVTRDMGHIFEIFNKSHLLATASTDEKLILLARELSLQRKIIIIETFLVLFLLAYVTLTRETRVVEQMESQKKSVEISSPVARSTRKRGKKR